MKTVKLLLVFCILVCTVAFAAVEPTSVQKLVLQPGWNLVTLLRPLEPDSASAFLALKPLALEKNCYVLCTTPAKLKTGCGYWVFSREGKTLELVQDVEKDVVEPTLTAGWNLVGYKEGWTWPEQASKIWQWNNKTGFEEVKKTDLEKDGTTYYVVAK